MVETNLGKRGGAEGDCGGSIQGGAVVGRGCEGDRRLTKELLETMFAEENPHEQFRLFASCLWSSGSASMSTPVRITAEYDFHNIIFCKEQNFTIEQTIAFRGITLSVFEATIVRGELDLEGAFEAFTERVLSLAEVQETHAAHSATGSNSGGTSKSNSHGSSNVGEANNKANSSISNSGIAPHSSEGIPGAKNDNRSMVEPASSTVSAPEGLSRPVRDEGGAAAGGRGPVFSVGEVDAITRFVARGLYRNFTLYRMCFEQEVKTCSEVRQVQVETPLEQPPLLDAEPV